MALPRRLFVPLAFAIIALGLPAVGRAQVPVEVWETTGGSVLNPPQPQQLLDQQADAQFAPGSAGGPLVVNVNDAQHGQTMIGFGGAMTESSAYELLKTPNGASLTQSLFNPSGIGLDLVRIPIGASDFDPSPVPSTEDDTPGDRSLSHFSVTEDTYYLIPALQAAIRQTPSLRFIAAPWTAPPWMKKPSRGCPLSSNGFDGGTLRKRDDALYARYLTKFAKAYAAKGIPIWAMTIQNEPENCAKATPSMVLSPQQEADVANYLGPDLAAAHLSTIVLGFDHNWNTSPRTYPTTVLHLSKYVSGTAYHCYGGYPSVQPSLSAGLGSYETECTPGGSGTGSSFSGDLVYNTGQEVIQAVQYGSASVMLWNLALSASDGPTQTSKCVNACLPVVKTDTSDAKATSPTTCSGRSASS